MEHVTGPDFPTGGMVYGIDGIRDAYTTGRGRVVMRGRAHTEERPNGGDRIIVTEIPFMVNKSRLIEQPVRVDAIAALDEAGDEFRFAAAVAAFGQLLKGGEYVGGYGYGNVVELAVGARGADPFGYRGEFLGLVRLADSLSPG